MKILDLFSGIGGFSVAGHALGWETVAFVERDKFCQAVLKTQFGDGIEIYDDITTFSGKPFRGRCDIVTAGFPCQPFSAAGQRRGDTDDRFLWPETVRIVDEARPEWCVFENVAGLLSMVESDTLSELEIEALQLFHEDIDTPVTKTVERIHRRIIGRIIGDLEAIGYSPLRMPDGTPVILCLPACAVGAWHRRDRLWIVAYRNDADSVLGGTSGILRRESPGDVSAGSVEYVADGSDSRSSRSRLESQSESSFVVVGDDSRENAGDDTDSPDTRTAGRQRQQTDDAGSGRCGSDLGRSGERVDGLATSTDCTIRRRQEFGPQPKSAADFGECGVSSNDPISGRENGQHGFEPRGQATEHGDRFEFDHWLEAAGELCRVVHGLPEELDAADVQTLEQAVKCLGREEAERAVGFDLGEIENRVWRTERLKALGNTIYPEVVLQVFGVIDELKKG